MPNWCNNKLIVHGISHKAFSNLYGNPKGINMSKKTLSFEKVIPIGEWNYHNAIEAWGTKWEIGDELYFTDYGGSGFELDFLTAWSPPEPVIEKLRELHPDADIKLLYYEEGCAFCGINKEGESATLDLSINATEMVNDDDFKSYIYSEIENNNEEEELIEFSIANELKAHFI